MLLPRKVVEAKSIHGFKKPVGKFMENISIGNTKSRGVESAFRSQTL